ncbi:hypothetical protein AB7M35_003438 [Amorphus suaedae]
MAWRATCGVHPDRTHQRADWSPHAECAGAHRLREGGLRPADGRRLVGVVRMGRRLSGENVAEASPYHSHQRATARRLSKARKSANRFSVRLCAGNSQAAHPEPVRASALGVRGINHPQPQTPSSPRRLRPGVFGKGIGGARNGGHPIGICCGRLSAPHPGVCTDAATLLPRAERSRTFPPLHRVADARAVACTSTKGVRENRVFEAMRGVCRLLSRRTPLAIGTPSLPVRYTRARPAVRPSTHVAVGPARLPAGQATRGGYGRIGRRG